MRRPYLSSSMGIVKKSQITDEYLLTQGRIVFDQAKTGQQLFFNQMRKDMDMYDGKFSERERKFSELLGVPRLFIPKTFVNTQRILVDVIETLFFDTDEIVSLKANKQVPLDHIKAVKTILNHRLNCHPIDFYKEAFEGSLDAIRNMICVFKVYPQIETETVIEKVLKE